MFYRTNLKISGLMTMDSGMFQCLASNPAGNIQSSAFLNVFHAGNCKGFPFVYLSAMLCLKEIAIFGFTNFSYAIIICQ